MLVSKVRQIDRAAAMFQKAAELTRLRIVAEQRSESGAVLAEQLETDLGIRRITLGPAGFESLAVASRGGRIHRIESDKLRGGQGAQERTFGLLEAEGDGASTEAFPEGLDPGRDGFGGVGESGGFALAGGAVVKTEGMALVGPVQPDQGGEVSFLGGGKLCRSVWSVHFIFLPFLVVEHGWLLFSEGIIVWGIEAIARHPRIRYE